MRRISKGFSRVDTPLFDGMLVRQQVQAVEDAAEDEDDDNEVSAEPTQLSTTPATPSLSPTQEHIPSPPQAHTAQPSSPPPQQPSQTTDILMTLLNTLLETCATLTKQVANLEHDKIAQAIEITKLKQRVKRRMHPNRGGIAKLDADDDVTLEEVDAEVAMDVDVQGRLVESQAKPAEVEEVIEVVTAAKLMIEVVTTAATTITTAQVPKASASRRRRGQKQEGNKRKGDSLNQDATKKRRIDEETEELKTHLQIVANDDDDVYTEATPLALKVLVVDYQIHHEHNKPYYKIIRADGTYQLFLSFITLLKNFDREDLEMLQKLVQERFQSSEPKNFQMTFC
uniref:Uncharacterized protein n=1 Tax=Tanacetum cinerariifolium TaxID=118510 RepID=A0A6L2P0T0_TANCI|nr:hypothetical protein [Tanacetum cinerariifolium]